MVQNLDYKELKDMNLCKFVLNELKRAVERFKDKGSKTNTAEGPAALPLLFYLDTRNHAKALRNNNVPRVQHLNKDDLKKIVEEDKAQNEKTFRILDVSTPIFY